MPQTRRRVAKNDDAPVAYVSKWRWWYVQSTKWRVGNTPYSASAVCRWTAPGHNIECWSGCNDGEATKKMENTCYPPMVLRDGEGGSRL